MKRGDVINGQWLWANFAEARRREQGVLAVAHYEYQVGLVYQTPENNFHNSDLVCDVLCKGAVSRAICL